ncbi:G/U mismatch-specific uracil-DNA glycosylase [Stenotrophomonas rhizophila]|uniref:DNA-deoxyinosine glycosylase n=1 Tax=Stenotrophomonas rhizophila TaxID=216778 RepID=UPI000F4BBF43|nr:DNA-deoxyinosine glycosylase [Stenotrophomonas rhizophila]ROP76485.1 G/U mismatch-specific uracil-DNA glycosylase [Stenotrophomonas rhizophila]
MKTTTCIGFPAQLNVDCRVLVLGSMPGVASLQAAQYYAHPRNRFWPLMGVLCGIDATLSYPDRVRALNARGVGVWDVIGQCERRGSLDASIVRGSEVPNALGALIDGLPALRAIACNGGTAYRAFQRFIVPALLDAAREVPVWSLPSTSPANAAWPLPRLVEAWQPLADAIRR